jgi:hypothetical protein
VRWEFCLLVDDFLIAVDLLLQAGIIGPLVIDILKSRLPDPS